MTIKFTFPVVTFYMNIEISVYNVTHHIRNLQNYLAHISAVR